jgi:hypothetical protein
MKILAKVLKFLLKIKFFLKKRVGQSGVLRISFAMALLFVAQIIGSAILAKFYDYGWPMKFLIFFSFIVGFFFADSSVFNLNGYAWFARILGFFFVILQQVILLDVAYSWNEKWLEFAGDEEGEWKWKTGLVLVSLLFNAASYSAIGVMFWQFSGCADSNVIMSLTVILPVLANIAQLFFSDQGSILTSAIVTAYAAYVCYSAVTLNPDSSCNPTLQTGYQTLSTVFLSSSFAL